MSVFSGIGDFIAQKSGSYKNSKPFDWRRCRRFAMKGIGCGIIWSYWFWIAEIWSESMTLWVVDSVKFLKAENQSTHAVVKTISSILLEQCVACPIIFGLWDIPVISLMNGTPMRDIPKRVKGKLWMLLLAYAKLWTLFNVVIYNVPLKCRIFVMSFGDLIWESIVSSMATGDGNNRADKMGN
eukprot:scaffold229402_cov66-Attheya_sp.AAC.1